MSSPALFMPQPVWWTTGTMPSMFGYCLRMSLWLKWSATLRTTVAEQFTDAITVISEKEARRAAKAAAKAAKKSPLTDGQKQIALAGAYGSFALCALAVLGGLYLIVVR